MTRAWWPAYGPLRFVLDSNRGDGCDVDSVLRNPIRKRQARALNPCCASPAHGGSHQTGSQRAGASRWARQIGHRTNPGEQFGASRGGRVTSALAAQGLSVAGDSSPGRADVLVYESHHSALDGPVTFAASVGTASSAGSRSPPADRLPGGGNAPLRLTEVDVCGR